jgi:MFS transporter, FSR family, fosmidomycin resistance protein
MSSNKTLQLVLTAFALWMGHFVVDFMIGIWSVFKTLAGLDLAKAGIIAAACAFLGEGMQVVFGSLSDKGYRKVLVLGGILGTISSLLIPFTHSYVVYFLLYLMTCLGSGSFHPSAVSLMGALSEKRKGVFITLFATGGSLGLATSQIIFSTTYRYFDGNVLILALPSLLLAILVLFHAFPQPKVAPCRKSLGFKAFGEFFKRKDLRALYISQVCNQGTLWAITFMLPDILLSRGYEPWICYGGGHMCFMFGIMSMMIPAGYLADKYSAKHVILYSSVAGFAFLYYFLLTPDLPAAGAMGLLFSLGATLGLVNPVALAFGARLVPNNPGMISAFLMGMVWCAAEVIGPAGSGILADIFANENAPSQALLVLGMLLPVGIYASQLLPNNSDVAHIETPPVALQEII